jgi:hypothetical protein
MSSPLATVLSGAKDALSQSDTNPAPVAGGRPRQAARPLPVKPPAKTPAKARPAPQNTKATDEDQNSEPKRIQFPSGVVAEVPGDWEKDALNEFARTVHAAGEKAGGSPTSADDEKPEGNDNARQSGSERASDC